MGSLSSAAWVLFVAGGCLGTALGFLLCTWMNARQKNRPILLPAQHARGVNKIVPITNAGRRQFY